MKAFKRILSLFLVLAILAPAALARADDEEAPPPETESRAVTGEVSQGQRNIVLRARQLMELQWTPLYDRYQWGYRGVFTAGTTYTGAPYGQPVHTGYIGIDISLDDFVAAVEDGTSAFYSEYSWYNKVAPFYSMDCSGFVSYAWDLPSRKSTGTIPTVAEKLADQSVAALEIGDCLNDVYSHAVLVSDVVRDADGQVISVEIMEETPVITRTTRYGEGGSRTLAFFENYYFNGGYVIYRYPERDSVEYTHSCAVPLDGEWCEECRTAAPFASVQPGEGCKTVTLSHADSAAAIYYTLDGAEPDATAARYTGPITVTEEALLKAVAVGADGSLSRVLTFDASVQKAQAPGYTLGSGMYSEQSVSAGSTVALSSATPGAVIYYTLDGSTPTAESSVYTGPIPILEDTTIKAFAQAEGYRDSDEVSFTFLVTRFSAFEDVAPDAWYAAAVDFAYSNGLFRGTSETAFSPGATMTRGMFVTVLGRLAGVPSGLSGRIGLCTGDDVNLRAGPGTTHDILGTVNRNRLFTVLGWEDGWYRVSVEGTEGYIIEKYVKAYTGQFSDLNEAQYYSPYVQWAWLTGVSAGTGSGSFSADSSITREDMAVLLYNYARSAGLSLSVKNDKAAFSDDGSITAAKREAVYALQQAGVINGMGDGTFAPGGSATRAQVAQIFMNFALAAG